MTINKVLPMILHSRDPHEHAGIRDFSQRSVLVAVKGINQRIPFSGHDGAYRMVRSFRNLKGNCEQVEGWKADT